MLASDASEWEYSVTSMSRKSSEAAFSKRSKREVLQRNVKSHPVKQCCTGEAHPFYHLTVNDYMRNSPINSTTISVCHDNNRNMLRDM